MTVKLTCPLDEQEINDLLTLGTPASFRFVNPDDGLEIVVEVVHRDYMNEADDTASQLQQDRLNDDGEV